jgi:hypothetical protein
MNYSFYYFNLYSKQQWVDHVVRIRLKTITFRALAWIPLGENITYKAKKIMES